MLFCKLFFSDQFYEMLREWEDNHIFPGWNMMDVMGDRIRSLINVKLELANLIHFSRLFQSQLLQVINLFSLLSPLLIFTKICTKTATHFFLGISCEENGLHYLF